MKVVEEEYTYTLSQNKKPFFEIIYATKLLDNSDLVVALTNYAGMLRQVQRMQKASRKEDLQFWKQDKLSEMACFIVHQTHELRQYFDAFILYVREQVAGFSLWNVWKEGNAPCLRQIYIKPQFRGNGYANVLIDAVLGYYKKHFNFELWFVEAPNATMFKILQKRSDVERIRWFK
jgi:GNAT superfamily N-acetyltransferase